MFCTQCGNEIADGSSFCTNCGAVINNISQVNDEEFKKNVVGKVFSFKTNVISYIYKTTIVTFKDSNLAIGCFKPKKIMYNQIEYITLQDKINIGELFFLVLCIIILLSGFVNASIGSIAVAIIVGIPTFLGLNNTIVSIKTTDGKINKIVMSKKDSEKDNFLNCLQTIKPCDNVIKKNNKSIIAIVIILVVSIFGIYSYISNINCLTVDDVKNGILYDYPDETIGEAFEDYFYDCSWDSFTVEDDDDIVYVVEFTGYIYDCNYKMAKVLIQFTHESSDDSSDFEIYCLKIGDDYFDYYGDILSTVYSDGDCSFMHKKIFTDFE